ncbi:trypsin-like [Ambystoma mexicanum]|uniref:trypsin-like n=1 Tax=Ambystoma mexicanum TaxID=8296 RepID=UPI0037E81EA6
MKLVLLLAALLGATAAAPWDDDKIIGGYDCKPHSQPWQVYFTASGRRWCGGSLINENWIISAAHCYKSPGILVAHLGEHDTTLEEGTEQRLKVEKAIPHPNYDSYSTDNDFMLVKLATPAKFNAHVQPIKIGNSCPAEGAQCLVSGWGNLRTSGVKYPDVLQCLDLPILSTGSCKNSYPGMITNNMFCAGYLEGGKDSCQGDSGGPLVCGDQLMGVVSWGYGCAQRNYPGVYVPVCNYISWAEEIMAQN